MQQETNFTVGPFYFFPTYKNYGINRALFILIICHVRKKKHSKSHIHVHFYLQLKSLKERSVDLLLDAQGRNDITRCNEKATKTRVILRRFMDAACCSANKQLTLLGHDESFTSLNKGNFLDFLNLLKNCGPLL